MRPDVREALERHLDADVTAGTPVLSRPGMLSRRHYYRLAGMATPRSGGYADGLFERYERLLDSGAATQWETRREEICRRLRRLVSEDFERGTLVRDAHGKASRIHYTAAIGVNRLMACRFLKPTFVELDDLVGRVPQPRPARASRGSRRSVAGAPKAGKKTAPLSLASDVPGDVHLDDTDRVPGHVPTRRNTSASERPVKVALGSGRVDGLRHLAPAGPVSLPAASKSEHRLPVPELPCTAARAAPRREAHRDALRRVLRSHLDAGSVVMSRGGKISRKHYAKLIGLAETAVRQTVRDIFEEFEAALGNPERLHDLRLPEMRAFLDAEWKAGRLGVRDGRVDRKVFMERFGFKGGTLLTRYPKVRELFSEFDARVAVEGYLPLETRTLMDRLEALLADDPPLARNVRNVNRDAVAAILGVPVATIQKEPFKARLAQADKKHRDRLERDARVVLLHGRTFDFRALTQSWSDAFAASVTMRFSKRVATATKGFAKTLYEQTLQIFLHVGAYLASRADAGGKVREPLGQDDWEDGVRNLASKIRTNPDLKPTTKDAQIGNLNRFVQVYADAGIVPPLSGRIRGIKNADKLGGRLPSLVEAAPATGGIEPADAARRYVDFAAEVLREAAAKRSLDVEAEVDAFAQTIGWEIVRDPALAELSVPQACLRIIDRRLDALKRAAVSVINEARGLLERGGELLAEARLDADAAFDAGAFADEYLSASNPHHRSVVLRPWFPPLSVDPDRAIRNLLSFAEQSFGGTLPLTGPDHAPTGFGQFFGKRYLELGGRTFLEAHLNPSTDAVTAVLLCYLIETGANIAVGRTENVDCVRPSELKGHVALAGSKARAKGKAIIIDLEADSEAVRAIEWLRAANGRRRLRCDDDFRDCLFLVDGPNGVPQELTEFTLRASVKRIAATAEEFSDLSINPSMIRPSVLLKVAIENDGRIQAGAIVGRHGEEVSRSYQQRGPVLLMYDQTIRRFQERFAVFAAAMLVFPTRALGVSADEWETLVADVRRTGLGALCKGVDPQRRTATGACGSLDCWNECPSMLLVAEVETITDLQIWQASLRAAEGDWIRDRIERWERVWLPWLCFCDVVEEKLARGPGLAIWRAAAERRQEIEASPRFVPPQVW